MNDNAKKWVAALRSGEYKQTIGHLRTSDGFCCLGVACDVYAKETGNGKWSWAGYLAFKVGDDERTVTLPDAVRLWLGLQSTEGMYEMNDHTHTTNLADNNDSGEYDFNKIANVVESEPPWLFKD